MTESECLTSTRVHTEKDGPKSTMRADATVGESPSLAPRPFGLAHPAETAVNMAEERTGNAVERATFHDIWPRKPVAQRKLER